MLSQNGSSPPAAQRSGRTAVSPRHDAVGPHLPRREEKIQRNKKKTPERIARIISMRLRMHATLLSGSQWHAAVGASHALLVLVSLVSVPRYPLARAPPITHSSQHTSATTCEKPARQHTHTHTHTHTHAHTHAHQTTYQQRAPPSRLGGASNAAALNRELALLYRQHTPAYASIRQHTSA